MIEDLKSAEKGDIIFPAEEYVNKFPVKKHDHVLIPAGTIHCSGANTMVLEVSATPYIFTFKLWDWARVGLDGKPRPIHVEHGKNNIQWNRNTEWVKENLLHQDCVKYEDEYCKVVRTGLHEREFLDTYRCSFSGKLRLPSDGGVHMLNLVEGTQAVITSPENKFEPFTVHYAETFIIPAAAGGNISGYLSAALSKGILKNVDIKTGQNLTARDAAVMVYNALGTEVLQCVYNGKGTEYKTFDDETLLYKYRKMRRGKGIVEATRYAAVDNGKTTGENEVRINGENYRDINGFAEDWTGYAVEFYYTEDENGDMSVDFVWKDTQKNDEIAVDRGNFIKNEGRGIFYEEKNRQKSKTIPETALIIYNGAAIYEYDSTLFNFANKKAILLDNNSDGKIDVVIISEGTDRYIGRLDTENGIIYDGLSKEEIHINDGYDRVRIFNDEGKEINLFSVSESEVITEYTSTDGSLMDIYVSKKQMTGKAEERSESREKTYYTVAGERYYASAALKKYMEISVGTSYDFYLNYMNEIVYVKTAAEKLNYGYLVQSSREGGFGDTVCCRILADDGEFYTYNLAANARVDGKAYKQAEKYTEVLSAPQLIRYEINEADEITVIDTPVRESGETPDSLNSFGAKNQMSYNSALVGFEGRLKLDSENTLVFFCPSNSDGREGYGVAKADYLKSSEKYMVQGFSSSEKNCVAEAVVIDGKIESYRKVDKFSKSYVVKDIVWTVNDENEVVRQFTVFNRTTEYKILCADSRVGENEDIRRGDIINAAIDGKGRFCDVVKVYDAKTHTKLPMDFEGAEFTSRCLMAAGYVYFNNGTTIGISTAEPVRGADFIKNELSYFKVNDNLGVIVDSNYDESDERYIRCAAMSEVKDYLNYEECAQVFVRTDQGNSAFIVVYQ